MRVKLAALVPAWNEEAVIAKTLESLLRAGMPKEDIYVINDGSKDRTAEIAEGLGVNVITNEVNIGKAEGVTRALENLRLLDRYTHVSFLDADTLVHPKYFSVVRNRLALDLRNCEKQNKKRNRVRPIGVLCGNPKSIPHNWLTAWRAYQYFLADVLHKPAQAKFRGITVSPGCASTYSVEILRQVKWTDDTRTEDMDVTVQAALLGANIVYESNAMVYTQDPANLKDYVGQVAGRWYTGAWQIMNKYGILWRGPLGRIHWESRITMVIEPFLFFLALYFGLGEKTRLVKSLEITFATTFVLAVVASVREKRLDIALFSLIYPFMWLVDFVLFLRTSTNLVTGPQRRKPWYSVPRYTMNTTTLDSKGD